MDPSLVTGRLVRTALRRAMGNLAVAKAAEAVVMMAMPMLSRTFTIVCVLSVAWRADDRDGRDLCGESTVHSTLRPLVASTMRALLL